ncbi:SOS response-associated peptidase [Brevundimonas sp.]|uniref:SOS response-associated peptidase family protein n=1 Tax=Brevundimonas sp. TaxID=1871086 RepID=UPI001A1B630E|nr:SOS response-associated peptidase [Brevundimonas sp.]MBJ7483495.1 SOS response-associated peptidase [Brevundimonas sp.]
MCNEYQLILPFDDVIETFNRNGDRLVFPGGMPNFGPMASIRIGDRSPVISLGPSGAELTLTPWAWRSPQGRPVFNFRSDDRSFANSARCLIPADGFFEFTDAEPGQKKKTKWRFRLAGAPLFWVAGIVKDGAFAMLTTEPGPDIAPYHDRQIVVLRPEDGAAWLYLQKPEAELLRALPAGRLDVEKVFPVAA